MIEEAYVSFEVAKLLKEKGFDVYGDGPFGSEIKIWMVATLEANQSPAETSRN